MLFAGAGSNPNFCQFCRCLVRKRCSGIRGKLKEVSKFNCQTFANQQADRTEDYRDIKLNGQSPETVEKFPVF